MNKSGTINNYGYVYTYELTESDKDLISDKLIEYYTKNCLTGESIMQDDDSIIEAPEVLSEIADEIIKFKHIK